jgi:hypothetical protein
VRRMAKRDPSLEAQQVGRQASRQIHRVPLLALDDNMGRPRASSAGQDLSRS